MTIAIQQPPFQQPFLDKNGKISTVWHLWLVNVFNSGALAAPEGSPAFTGTPTAPTAAPLTDSTQIATTAYADAAVAVEEARAEAAEATLTASVTAANTAIAAETARAEGVEATKAPLASPVLTGTPSAPVLELTAATPTGAGANLGLGNTTGVGNGSNANIQAPARGTGSGPATPGTVVKWLEIDLGGTKYWIPLCQ